MMWAAVLLALMLAWPTELRRLTDRLFLGFALGSVLTAMTVVWERIETVGLLDFSSDYRVSGLMSAMHTGGAYIDGFLVLSTPFVWLQVIAARRLIGKALWTFAALAGVYAIFVTFSRGAVLGLGAAVLVWAVAFALAKARSGAGARRPVVATASVTVALVIVGALAATSLTAPYMRARVTAATEDLGARLAHWRDSLGLVARSGASLITGAGIGRYAALKFWAGDGASQPPSYRIASRSDAEGRRLLLGGGKGLYVEQRVPVARGESLVLSFRARGTGTAPRIDVGVCRKGIVQSVGCSGASVALGANWQDHSLRLDVPGGGAEGRATPWGVVSLSNGVAGTVVEINGLALRRLDGTELTGNGGFEDGMDRWFISSDDHLAWHVKNLYLHLVVESGILGLAAFLALVGLALVFAARAVRRDAAAIALIAGVAGFLVVGAFDSLVDSPRIMLALLMLVNGALCRWCGAVADAAEVRDGATVSPSDSLALSRSRQEWRRGFE
jgi:hypothetical protein